MYGNFSRTEYTHALRLASELADLRVVGYANPYSNALRLSAFDECTGHHRMKKALQMECFILW